MTVLSILFRKLRQLWPFSPSRGSASPQDFDFDVACRTDVGCVRSGNQDAVRYVRASDPELMRKRGVLAVVADGMGGHQAGEVASAMAIDIIGQRYFTEASGNPRYALQLAFEEANRSILKATAGHPERAGMGTTGTALAICSGRLFFAHVGDTRLYRCRAGDVEQLTEDHTEVGELLRAGMLTPDEARHHPFRNVITRALGTSPSVVVDTGQSMDAVAVNDAYLLCSDGLHDLVTDEEFGEIMQNSSAAVACEKLVDLALSRGGHDNVSALVVRLVPPAKPPAHGDNGPITRV